MDTLAFDTAPQARRLVELLKERGWSGWTRLKRVDPPPETAVTQPEDTAVQRARRER